MRIHITGNAGAGKSTLAREIGERLGIPVNGLDAVVWRPGWRKTPPAERQRLEEDLIRGPAWVIEGVSARVRAASDWVIFLDVPRHVCLWRAIRRNVRYFLSTRPGLPENCPEWRILPRLVRIIVQFPAGLGAEIRAEAQRSPRRYSVVRQPAAVAELVARLVALEFAARDLALRDSAALGGGLPARQRAEG